MAKKTNGRPEHPVTFLRKERGLSQSQLGALIGVSGISISQIEGGFVKISDKVFYNIVQVLDIDPILFEKQLEDYKVGYKQYLIEHL